MDGATVQDEADPNRGSSTRTLRIGLKCDRDEMISAEKPESGRGKRLVILSSSHSDLVKGMMECVGFAGNNPIVPSPRTWLECNGMWKQQLPSERFFANFGRHSG
jgi:hypothetical protein